MNNPGLMDMSYILAILIEICVPIALAIIISKKYKVSWAVFFLGLALFIVSLIRIPLNNYVSGIIQNNFGANRLIATIMAIAFASVTAGLFEEGVRVLGIGYIIRNKNYHKGIMYGIGHGGGGESMIFVGLSLAANYLIFRFFPAILPQSTVEQFYSTQWYLPLVGALERMFAIVIQISLSVLIMHAFLKKKYYFILVAFIYHAVIDFIVACIAYYYGLMFAEIAASVFAAIGITIIVLLRTMQKNTPSDPLP